jgi:uncharacterized coiled-coil DUF342 family protein
MVISKDDVMEQINQFRQKLQELNSSYNKHVGARDAHLQKLKKDFNCSTIDAARKKRDVSEAKIVKLKQSLDQKIREFNKRFAQ